jgi:hypothetical protein
MKTCTFQLIRKGLFFTELQEDDVIYYNQNQTSIGFVRFDRKEEDELWPLKINGQKEFHLDFLDKKNFERLVKLISAITGFGYEKYKLRFAGMARTMAYRFTKP